jgi:HlyD family secretion protein
MQIEAAVSEADVGGLEEGQKVTFQVDAFPSRQFDGLVQQVRYEPTTNQSVISYTTIVAVDNKDLKLRPGMTANAKFITGERRGVVTVPNSALRFRPPEDAVIKADPAAPTGSAPEKPAVELATSGPFAGLPVQPWMAGGQFRRPTDEERTAYEASLTAEQKEKYQKLMAEFRARMSQGGGQGGGGFGGGGPGAGGGGSRRQAQPEAPKSGTVYLVEKETTVTGGEKIVLQPVTLKLGITDGSSTEVLEGLKEGDVLAIGTSTAAVEQTSNPLNPFANRRR